MPKLCAFSSVTALAGQTSHPMQKTWPSKLGDDTDLAPVIGYDVL